MMDASEVTWAINLASSSALGLPGTHCTLLPEQNDNNERGTTVGSFEQMELRRPARCLQDTRAVFPFYRAVNICDGTQTSAKVQLESPFSVSGDRHRRIVQQVLSG